MGGDSSDRRRAATSGFICTCTTCFLPWRLGGDSIGRRRAPKGSCEIGLADLLDHATGQILIALPSESPKGAIDPDFENQLISLRRRIGPAVHLAASHLYRGDDRARIEYLAALVLAASLQRFRQEGGVVLCNW